MELETMFTEQKWNIIKCLSNKDLSPLQLAEKLDTSMANVSQQLRLLEASQLVKKSKIKNRDKGKPRTLFSLRDDYAYLVSMSKHFANKKLLKVSDHQKITLSIWFIENELLQKQVESAYWKLSKRLKDIDGIAVDQATQTMYVATNKAMEGPLTELKIKFISPKQFENLVTADTATVLFNPHDYSSQEN